MGIEAARVDWHSTLHDEFKHLAIWTLYSMASVVLKGTYSTITL